MAIDTVQPPAPLTKTPEVTRPSVRAAPSSLSDEGALLGELRRRVRGEVRFDAGSRALYSTDASNYRQIPIGVVIPRDVEDVITTVELCRQYGAPVLPRGGGTSLAGQCCNVAVVVDFSKYMNRVTALDPDRKTARVEPGLVLDDLRNTAEQYNLTFGPDPATHNRCTLGGMIGNNSCGVHSLFAGMTDENVEELDIVTYDGLRMRVGRTSDDEFAQILEQGGRRAEIYRRLRDLRDRYAPLIRSRYPEIPHRVSGYNLPPLLPENGFDVARALVGSEGTCVTVLEATARLVNSPPGRALVVLGYPDIYTACDQVPELLEYEPIGLEGFDDYLVEDTRKKALLPDDVALLPKGRGWLLVEFGGKTRPEAADAARHFVDRLKAKPQGPDARLFPEPDQQARVWRVRESALGATAQVPGERDEWPGWEDSAVPPDREGDYLRDLRHLLDRYHYHCSFYGHFGQGCIHVRIDFDLETREGIARFLSFMNDAADLVIRYGGSLSGEHGDGQSRAELLPKMFGEELVQAFGEFKAIWDPQGKMNPGKVVDPYRMDQNLRLGLDYNPARPKTHFKFPEDEGSFAHAALRCVGVGLCRRGGGGTMCPSYMVTREEMHSTRGRARLLFEMLQGQVIGHDGWRDRHVKDALDLCLACKGCKGDCPVNVDMATYKAEFLSHYYQGHVRPRSAYAFGLIYWWSRLASPAPRLANFLTQSPLLRDAAKWAAGMAPERQIPAFAPENFKSWFRRRGVRNQGKPQVILWPDTFNNYFLPDTAKAAVAVLEAAGFQVTVPGPSLCCGRPLYDYGFLDQAQGLLRQILGTLGPQISAGVPIVGLEPSCVAVFRDELVGLFPNDEHARRLQQQTYTLGEFLEKKAREWPLPRLDRKALLHGHCHQKAIMKMDSEVATLSKLGVDLTVLDSGCCGMAGSFGFEKGDHYDVSIKAGERVLLPAVRQANAETLVVADGFSCREQIAQTTGCRALHLAQVIELALRHDAEKHAHAAEEHSP
ncbi:MAG: FAD-binding protein [Chloroflexi bacterium]|nr:FAD-binding protein [Chloroflexota bacterium]